MRFTFASSTLLTVITTAAIALPAAAAPVGSCPSGDVPLRASQGGNVDVRCDDGTTLSVTQPPQHGHLDLYQEWASATYTPFPAFTGMDGFTLAADRAGATSTTAYGVEVGGTGGQVAGGCQGFSGLDMAIRAPVLRGAIICDTKPDSVTVDAVDGQGKPLGQLRTTDLTQRPDGRWAVTMDLEVTGLEGQTGRLKWLAQWPSSGVGQDIAVTIESRRANLAPTCQTAPMGGAIEAGRESPLGNHYFCWDPEGDPVQLTATSPDGATRAAEGDVRFTPKATGTSAVTVIAGNPHDSTHDDVPPTTLGLSIEVGPQLPDIRCRTAPVSTPVDTPVAFTVGCSAADDFYLQPEYDGAGPTSLARHGSVDVGRPDAATGTRRIVYRPDPGFSGMDALTVVGRNRYREEEAVLPIRVGQADDGGGVLGDTTSQPSRAGTPVPADTNGGTPPSGGATVPTDQTAYLRAGVLPKLQAALRRALARGRTTVALGPFTAPVRFGVTITAAVPGKAGSAVAARRVRVARGSVSLGAARKGRLRLKVDRAARARLRGRRVAVRVQLRLADRSTGGTLAVRRTLRMRVR